MAGISLDNPIVRTYVVHCALLALKVLLMAALTARLRIKKAIFANPEDAATAGSQGKVKFDDADIERVRRYCRSSYCRYSIAYVAHLNDLENISIFFVVGFLYILTGPSLWLATLLYRVVTVARFLHTLVYAIVVVRQPARALAHLASFFAMWYMGITVVVHFFSDL